MRVNDLLTTSTATVYRYFSKSRKIMGFVLRRRKSMTPRCQIKNIEVFDIFQQLGQVSSSYLFIPNIPHRKKTMGKRVIQSGQA